MKITSIIDYLDRLTEPTVFKTLSSWEQQYVASLIRIFSFKKVRELTSAQQEQLVQIYVERIILPKLPAEMQKAQKTEKASDENRRHQSGDGVRKQPEPSSQAGDAF